MAMNSPASFDRRAWRRRGLELIAVGLVLLLTAALAAVFASPAVALPALKSAPSDPRAQFHDGNVTTCAAAGFAGDIQMGSASNTGASDVNLTGTVKTNGGAIQPGVGQEVDVAINPGAGVV